MLKPVTSAPEPLPAATAWSMLELGVADLGRSLDFYSGPLGLAVLERGADHALLGVPGGPALLGLRAEPGARPKAPHATGLYHFAVLMPSRLHLAHALRRLAESEYPLQGVADHLVSEALYLGDPDGNGIELYRDRPRAEWPEEDGRVRMANAPLDLRALLAETAGAARAEAQIAPGTVIGHLHLQVGDLARAEAFYVQALGFDVMANWTGALFVAAGGYHHHLGLNTWQTRGGGPAPAGMAGLRGMTLVVPDAGVLARSGERLAAGGWQAAPAGDALAVSDPWGLRLVLRAD